MEDREEVRRCGKKKIASQEAMRAKKEPSKSYDLEGSL